MINWHSFLCINTSFSKIDGGQGEDGILKLKPYVTNALETGLEDGNLCSVDEMYFSLTHTLLSLIEKLSVGGDILTSDQIVEGNVQLQVMTGLILKGLAQKR